MPVSPFAEVVTKEHPFWKDYLNGSRPTPPGRPLREVLADADGRYEFDLELPARILDDVRRQAAADPSDASLAAAARSGKVRVCLESFRGLDPDTRVRYGFTIGAACLPESSADD